MGGEREGGPLSPWQPLLKRRMSTSLRPWASTGTVTASTPTITSAHAVQRSLITRPPSEEESAIVVRKYHKTAAHGQHNPAGQGATAGRASSCGRTRNRRTRAQ